MTVIAAQGAAVGGTSIPAITRHDYSDEASSIAVIIESTITVMKRRLRRGKSLCETE